MQEYYHKWYSQYLSRDFEMLVFGHSGYPVIVFPTSKGRYYEAKDFGLVRSAEQMINEGRVKIYCPDGIDWESWYNYGIHPSDRVKTHMAYERLIINDVINFALYECNSGKAAVAGCSFGAYHAMNTAFRNPDKVGYLFSMSGAFNVRQFIMGYYNDDCYYNNPPDYMPGLNDEWYLNNIKDMGIILGVGQHDICIEENRNMAKILSKKHIPHWLDIRQGFGHDWHWWCDMFPHYLSKIN